MTATTTLPAVVVRTEASGTHWKEQFVDHERAATASSVEVSVCNSWSIVVIDNFASLLECQTMLDSAMNKSTDDESPHVMGASFVNRNCTRHCVSSLEKSANTVHETLFHRLLEFLERDLYGVFNQEQLTQQQYEWYAEPDETGTLQSEPKVNLYTQDGVFAKHVDGMKLTLFVMLNDAYGGLGTAFYANEETEGSSSSSLVVRPEHIGTAMIWGGHLVHSALPTTSGMRAVYVGSFDMV